MIETFQDIHDRRRTPVFFTPFRHYMVEHIFEKSKSSGVEPVISNLGLQLSRDTEAYIQKLIRNFDINKIIQNELFAPSMAVIK